jgi:tetratricopeptide (TPR) repeat protein
MGIKFIKFILFVLLAVCLAACPKPPLKEVPVETEESATIEETAKENPRVAASLQLTDQGRRLIEERMPDKAIRVLEQAVSLHPTNGQNYYYLSEAWLMKGSAAQAKEFNQLAEIHLKEDRPDRGVGKVKATFNMLFLRLYSIALTSVSGILHLK